MVSPYILNEAEEGSMSLRLRRGVEKVTNGYASHIPIPYGCISLAALTVGLAALAVFSTVAIGMTIFK